MARVELKDLLKIKMASGNTASILIYDDPVANTASSIVASILNGNDFGINLGSPSHIMASVFAAIHQDDDAHDTCSLTACLNPLHPGPCKGWKHSLFTSAPQAWHALEAARVEKANAARIKKIQALKEAGKPIPHKLLVEIKPKLNPHPGQTAKAATGEAHAAGQGVSKAAGVVNNAPGKVMLGQATKTLGQTVQKGPKGKKPTLASKGIAFVIAQEKVTPQYKLDKAAAITPEQWNALSGDDKAIIRGELVKVQKDGFGPQQKKAAELLDKLKPHQELKAGTPGTVTTPKGTVVQKINLPPEPTGPKTVKEAKADGTLEKAAQAVADKAKAAGHKPVIKEAEGPAAPSPKTPVVKDAAKEAHLAKLEQAKADIAAQATPPVIKEAQSVAEAAKNPAPKKSETPKALPKHVEHAVAMAKGHAPGASWSKNHLAAYQPLSADEFHALPQDVKTKIVSELTKGKTKFLDPKKVKAAQALLDKFKGEPSGSKIENKVEKAAEQVSFGKHFDDHSVTATQAKQAVADVMPTTLFLAVKKVAGLDDHENPDSPELAKTAMEKAKTAVTSQTKMYGPEVLKDPAVKAAIQNTQDAIGSAHYAIAVNKAKGDAYNKISLALANGNLSPIQRAALQKYSNHLLDHPVNTKPEQVKLLTNEAAASGLNLNEILHKKLKELNAPKPGEMSGKELDSKVKDLLGSDTVDPTKPDTKLSLANTQHASELAINAADDVAKGYSPEVLKDPAVAAKYVAMKNAAFQYLTTGISKEKVLNHLKNLHDVALKSGHDVHDNPLSAADMQVIKLHKTKVEEEFSHLDTMASQQIEKLNKAQDAFKAEADKLVKPSEPVKLTDFDTQTIENAFSSAWGTAASKAVSYGTSYATQQKMKTHAEYPAFIQGLGNLRMLAGKIALAHAHENTARLNVPTHPDTGDLVHGPEYDAWKQKIADRTAVEKQFNALHKTAQERLDTIRAAAGLKKRSLPKFDAAAVKSKAAETGYYQSGSYSGPNYGKSAAAKNYMLAKVGDKLGVKHQSAAEKKLDKLKDYAPTAKTSAPKGTPVSLSGPGVAVPDDVKSQITSDFKAMPSGKYLADPASDIFDNLVVLSAAHGKGLPSLSVDDVLKSIDETHSKNLGVANSGMLHKKITEWLGTADGKAYAEAHSVPDPKKVKQLSGELDLPEGVTLAPGEKVQKVAGPGPHDTSLDHSAFKKASSVSAQVAQDQYMKDNGIKWTKDQKASLKGYTGSLYSTYNKYLRHGGSISPAFKQDIINIQSAMLPLAQHTLLRRGTGWDALPAEFHGFENAKKLLGKTIEEPGFTSTTVAGESGHFGGPLQLEIEAPKGTAAAFVNGISHYKNQENEMLLAAGTKFKVLEVTQKGHQTVMRVRIVGDK